MQSDMLKLARESGMTVLLDGRIGQQAYMSVSGSADALQKFAHDAHASLSREPRRKARAARSPSLNSLVMARMRECIAARAFRGVGTLHRRRQTPRGARPTLRSRSSTARCEPQ
ncbi:MULTISPECIES: hypothetical protein [Caballeronia]|uniref:hypothetical protein n=1 Tax=Caballeronia TaxID=1827195 RepID=UPI0002DC742D|nr:MULTISPECIES: hypothetical protein [Caballeronia]MDR5788490.1 hypothetical protein [Caballeronia sp. LP003]